MLKSALKVAVILLMAMVASPNQQASASHCDQGDPWFFCACARHEAQQCWFDYQACGGFFVEGCWETYSQCRFDSGVHLCE